MPQIMVSPATRQHAAPAGDFCHWNSRTSYCRIASSSSSQSCSVWALMHTVRVLFSKLRPQTDKGKASQVERDQHFGNLIWNFD